MCYSPLVQFNLYSDTLLSYAHYELRILAESLEAMSDSITSHGLQSANTMGESAWPYVSLPLDAFEAHTEHVMSFSRNKLVYTTPIVNEIGDWNAFNAAIYGASNLSFSPYLFIQGTNGKQPANGTGHFLPVHQVHTEEDLLLTSNSSLNNYDTSFEPGIAITVAAVSNVRRSVLSGLLSVHFIRDSFPLILDASEPLSIVVEPIFSTFQEKSEIVGYVQSLFQWKFFFSKFSTDGVSIICVVDNTCGDQITFILNKQSIEYVSYENARVFMFDGVSASAVIGADDVPNINSTTESETGICIYTLTIYPTIEFRQTFNANAVLCTVVVGLAMLSMVGAFFAFDM